jgi:hypothetical protein
VRWRRAVRMAVQPTARLALAGGSTDDHVRRGIAGLDDLVRTEQRGVPRGRTTGRTNPRPRDADHGNSGGVSRSRAGAGRPSSLFTHPTSPTRLSDPGIPGLPRPRPRLAGSRPRAANASWSTKGNGIQNTIFAMIVDASHSVSSMDRPTPPRSTARVEPDQRASRWPGDGCPLVAGDARPAKTPGSTRPLRRSGSPDPSQPAPPRGS